MPYEARVQYHWSVSFYIDSLAYYMLLFFLCVCVWLSEIVDTCALAGRNHNRDVGDVSIHGMEGGDHEGGSRSGAGQGLPTPESLAEVMQSTRQMLIEQVAGCLSVCA